MVRASCRCVDLPWAGGGRSGMEDWVVNGRPKGMTEERLTLKRSVGRNVHPASLKGERASPWRSTTVAGRRADGQRMAPEGVRARSAPVEGSKALLPTLFRRGFR